MAGRSADTTVEPLSPVKGFPIIFVLVFTLAFTSFASRGLWKHFRATFYILCQEKRETAGMVVSGVVGFRWVQKLDNFTTSKAVIICNGG